MREDDESFTYSFMYRTLCLEIKQFLLLYVINVKTTFSSLPFMKAKALLNYLYCLWKKKSKCKSTNILIKCFRS